MAAPDLNVAQLRAVEHSGGPLLVLAGPGTGKTGVLVSRIAHLVGERGVDPKRILALTFSRRAAEEMKERVRRRVPETVFIDARTFHSFALYVVRRQAAALGFSRAPEILPTAEQWALVSELLASEDPHEWGLSAGAFESPATVREVYDLLLRAQEHLLEPAQMRDLGEKSRLPHLVRAADLLQGSCLNSLMDENYCKAGQWERRMLVAEKIFCFMRMLVGRCAPCQLLRIRIEKEISKVLLHGEREDSQCPSCVVSSSLSILDTSTMQASRR